MTKGLRISVADDELDMRDFFERMLKRLGHQVVSVAENGRELVEHCREQRPDLVITDIKMPEMDGIEAAQKICGERQIPVILVSAYQDGKDRPAENDSVLAYLVKPIGPDDLVPAIAIAVRRFEELQTLRKESADLRQALCDRKVIEQAKGVLMKVAGLDEPTAFRRLQDLAAERNQKLVDAAESVVALKRVLRPASAE